MHWSFSNIEEGSILLLQQIRAALQLRKNKVCLWNIRDNFSPSCLPRKNGEGADANKLMQLFFPLYARSQMLFAALPHVMPA